MTNNEYFERIKAENEKKAAATKLRDRIYALGMVFLLSPLPLYYLSPVTQDIFDYGMGLTWTEESVLRDQGLLAVNFVEALIPALICMDIFHFPIYRFLRQRTLKHLWM